MPAQLMNCFFIGSCLLTAAALPAAACDDPNCGARR